MFGVITIELKVEYLPISKLKKYEKNTRKHDIDYDVQKIKKSIEKYGMNDPIGIWSDDNIIVEGHGRLMACELLGIEKVPVIRLDHLTDEERREYGIVHNKTVEFSTWDFDKLNEELKELDLSDFDLFIEEKQKDVGDGQPHGDVEFTEVLNEENNYIVLKFNNSIDWLQALTLFDLKQVKALSTRKDGVVTKKMESIGISRVLDGAKAIKKITGEFEE